MIYWNSTLYQYLVLLTDVYLSLDGIVIPNHGYVEIGDIGSISDNKALLCHTNGPATLGNIPYLHSGGEWYASNGNRVGGTPPVPGVSRTRGPMVVRLKRTGTPPEGIYQCEIEDADNTLQTVYVGLYNAGAGRVINNTICHCVPS